MSESNMEFMLSTLRVASFRAKMMEAEINSIGVALKGGMITPAQSVKWIKDVGLLDWVGVIPEEITKEIGDASENP